MKDSLMSWRNIFALCLLLIYVLVVITLMSWVEKEATVSVNISITSEWIESNAILTDCYMFDGIKYHPIQVVEEEEYCVIFEGIITGEEIEHCCICDVEGNCEYTFKSPTESNVDYDSVEVKEHYIEDYGELNNVNEPYNFIVNPCVVFEDETKIITEEIIEQCCDCDFEGNCECEFVSPEYIVELS